LTAEHGPGIVQVDSLGRRISARGKQQQVEALARHRDAVASALTLQRRTETSEQAIHADLRKIALQAMPAILGRMIRIATGQIKKAGAGAQIEAGKFVAQVAQVDLQAQAGANAGLISEMSLTDLEMSLRSAADAAHDLAAIESQSHRVDSPAVDVPNDGTAADDADDGHA
jgi:hypothetical protein